MDESQQTTDHDQPAPASEATPQPDQAAPAPEDIAPAAANGMPTVEDEIAALQAQAEEASDANRHAEALPYLTRWIELAPDDPEPLLLRAWEHRWNGDRVAARADTDQAMGRWPESARVAVEAGELYGELEAYEEEEAALNRAAPLIADDDADLLLRLADDYEEAELYEEALAMYNRLERVDPYGGRRGRSRVRRALGDPEGALRDLDAARDAFPADLDEPNRVLAWMWSDRASIQRELGDRDGALESARMVLNLTDDTLLISDALTTVAGVERERGDLAAARAAAEDALARDPQYWPAWQELIVMALDTQSEPEVLDLIHRAQEQMPTNYSLVSIAGMLQLKMGNANGVLDEWDRLIAAHPDDAEALASRASVHLELGHQEAARADVNRALHLAPDNTLALEVRAKLLLNDRQPGAALVALNQALREQPDDTELLLLRADTYMQLGNAVGAVADFVRVGELDPDDPRGPAGLGSVQLFLGQAERAVVSFEAALRLAPDSPVALYNLAAAYGALGRCFQALAYLRRAVAADPALAEDATGDESFDSCRSFPGFEAALRGEAAPATGGKGKKGGPPQGRPPRGRRK